MDVEEEEEVVLVALKKQLLLQQLIKKKNSLTQRIQNKEMYGGQNHLVVLPFVRFTAPI